MSGDVRLAEAERDRWHTATVDIEYLHDLTLACTAPVGAPCRSLPLCWHTGGVCADASIDGEHADDCPGDFTLVDTGECVIVPWIEDSEEVGRGEVTFPAETDWTGDCWLVRARTAEAPAPTDAREALARVGAELERSEETWTYDEDGDAWVEVAVIRAALAPTAPDAGQRDTQEPTTARAEAVLDFVEYIATQTAYNGAGDPGQNHYDHGLNPWLSAQALAYLTARADREAHP